MRLASPSGAERCRRSFGFGATVHLPEPLDLHDLSQAVHGDDDRVVADPREVDAEHDPSVRLSERTDALLDRLASEHLILVRDGLTAEALAEHVGTKTGCHRLDGRAL